MDKNRIEGSVKQVKGAVKETVGTKNPKDPAQNAPSATEDTVHKIDRPGFDLGGSSNDTHAGTGLGFGIDASDTPDGRRLPGRWPENKLTIPRWGGTELHGTTASEKKPSGRETQSAPETKKTR
ncbi:hypothetical protein [Thiocapsa sp.]|uniref:CsbD family protein n=1 Tax=Thiocapsa sp. TaxID=2024551 RepID=UPI003593F3D5